MYRPAQLAVQKIQPGADVDRNAASILSILARKARSHSMMHHDDALDAILPPTWAIHASAATDLERFS